MKKIILLLIVLLSIQSALLADEFAKGEPPAPNAGIVDVTPDFPWVHNGTVYFISAIAAFGPDGLGQLGYKSKDGASIVLSGRIEGLNALLKEEVAKTEVQDFLKDKMTNLLRETMGTPVTFLINEKNIIFNWPAERKLLEGYILTAPLKINGNEWSLTLNMATSFGSVEIWNVSGSIEPFRINTFCRKIDKPTGYLKPMKFIQ